MAGRSLAYAGCTLARPLATTHNPGAPIHEIFAHERTENLWWVLGGSQELFLLSRAGLTSKSFEKEKARICGPSSIFGIGAPEEIRTPNLLIRSQSSNLREDGGDDPRGLGLVWDDVVEEPPQHEERRGLGAFRKIGVAPNEVRPSYASNPIR
jgi:hypothetical protein